MSAEALRSSFTDLGVDVDEESLQECVRVCSERGVDADTLVEAWVAYSLSALGGAVPTVERVRQLERKEFCDVTAPAPRAGVLRSSAYTGEISQDLDSSNVISDYISSTTPKRQKPEAAQSQTHAEITPATVPPNVSHSAKYASRKNAGSVVLTYGDEAMLRSMDQPWDGSAQDINVSQIPNEDGVLFGSKAMFGFDLLHEAASVWDNQIRYLSQCIMGKRSVTSTASVRCKSQTEVYVAGRIDCDADARLNAQSVLLQGAWEESLSQSVHLDLQQCPRYDLFPGQVIVVRGTNPRGDRFLAQEVYTDATLSLHDHRSDIANSFTGTLNMLVASGPYTTTDSTKYEPLKDFIAYVGAHKPHVVLMTGPFLDVDHNMVKTPNLMAETYKAFFEKLVDNVAEISVASPHTKILLVSSLRDAFHQNIYPTPAYRARRRHNITMLPDPCTITVGGLAVGVTSSDVLMHLSQEEISKGDPSDKFSRLARYMVSQQCYYPLFPAAVPCDSALWAAHAHMTRTPHVLVTPSNLRYFAKEVNGCVVLNPEHLTKGTAGGTFAKLQVRLDGKAPTVACQIIRI